MKSLSEIELQLSRLGINNRFWGKPEMRELQHILAADEVITNAANGRHEGGFALLVATDRRLLLVDKKLWFLSLEDIRYDMISEIDYCARLLDSTVFIRTINKILRFTSFRQKQLRALTSYVQERVMDLRHQPQLDQTNLQGVGQPVVQPQATAQTTPLTQQFYVQTPVMASRPRPFRRIGAYPTASLTTNHRFSYRYDQPRT